MKASELIDGLKLLVDNNPEIVVSVNGINYEINNMTYNFKENEFVLEYNKKNMVTNTKKGRPYSSIFEKN